MGLSSSTLSLEGVAFSKLAKLTSIMFRFVALFALVAVAAAEPQWVHPYAVHNAAHLKTPSGDTVSVQAAKIQHHQLKANEYAKKAYVPYYHSNVVALPSLPFTICQLLMPPLLSHTPTVSTPLIT